MHGVVLQHCLVSESFHWLLYSAVCLVLCLHTHVHVQRSKERMGQAPPHPHRIKRMQWVPIG